MLQTYHRIHSHGYYLWSIYHVLSTLLNSLYTLPHLISQIFEVGSTIILTIYFKKQRPFLTRRLTDFHLRAPKREAEVDWVGVVKSVNCWQGWSPCPGSAPADSLFLFPCPFVIYILYCSSAPGSQPSQLPFAGVGVDSGLKVQNSGWP